MPRTIESIVANHQAASERRKAGRPVWDHTIRIKDLLDDDNLNAEQIEARGKQVADRIRAGTPKKWREMGDDFDFELDEMLAAFDSIKLIEEDETEEDLLTEFNGWLDQLYDWADGRRVWIG